MSSQGKLDRFMQEKEVLSVTSFSRTTLWREIKRGRFPQSVVISAGRVGWRASAIAAWQSNPENWHANATTEAA
ncbi:prophage regulatory protein [Pseudomonas protegens]|uniref:helix-turn-helix transcriptional regulator n=1 Tax=Pseudomonas protegens TaxID=380021 RepID=UPI001D167B90|nr:AlpA family phage regulatory protein [Pseudomonas protegens]